MALQVDIYRVDHRDGFSMPCLRLANRRAAGSPVLAWVCQRHLEILLFNRVDGGSSGAIWKALSQSGLGATSLCCSKKAVSDGVLLADEFTQIMGEFKKALPPDVCDPSSLGRSTPRASPTARLCHRALNIHHGLCKAHHGRIHGAARRLSEGKGGNAPGSA